MARKSHGDELDTDADTDMDLVFTADDEEKPRGVGSAHLAVAGVSPVRVRVVAPFQVVRDLVVYRPGDVAEVPESVAADWVRDGWVSLAE
jgi:hypothetical protein